MNKYLKAIDTIGKIQEFEGHSYYPLEVPIGFKLKYQKEFGLLLKLASKSEPIKPKKRPTIFAVNGSEIEQHVYFNECGNCEKLISRYSKFCENCGREIDWSEDESK